MDNKTLIEFSEIIRKKAQFHQNNENDPHQIGTACMVALTEIADAIDEAVENNRDSDV